MIVFVYSGMPRCPKVFKYQINLFKEVLGSDFHVSGLLWTDEGKEQPFREIANELENSLKFYPPKLANEPVELADEYAFKKRVASQFEGISKSTSAALAGAPEASQAKYVRLRTDLLIDERHLEYIKNITLEDDEVMFPHVGHYLGVNDMCWVANHHSMAKFSTLIDYLNHKVTNSGLPIVPEIILSNFCSVSGIRRKFSLWEMPSVLARDNGGTLSPHGSFWVNYIQHRNRAAVRGFHYPAKEHDVVSRAINKCFDRVRSYNEDLRYRRILKGLNS